MRARVIVLILLTLFGFKAKAQLNGEYIIGPQGDFQSLTLALGALNTQGMNGNVIFRIKSAAVNNFSINQFNSYNDTLTIESFYKNANLLIFNSVHLSYSNNIILKYMTIKRDISSTDDLLLINKGNNIRISNCRIIDDSNYYNLDNTSLNIAHPWNGSNSIYIDSTTIYSFMGIQKYCMAIEESGKGNSFFSHDTIIGNFDQFFYNSGTQKFNHCYIEFSNEACCFFSTVDSCVINMKKYSYSPKLKASTVKNSVLISDSSVIMGSEIKNCKNCKIYVPIKMSQVNNIYINNCIFYKDINAVFINNSSFRSCIFYKKCKLSYPDNVSLKNNFFYADLVLDFGSPRLSHNNFGPYSNIQTWASTLLLENNNFNTVDFSASYAGNIKNNNYYGNNVSTSYYSNFDKNPYFVDPQYASASDLHINNPVLFGSALSTSNVNDDIDGETRATAKSIGADEEWMQFPLIDTLMVECGQKAVLKLSDSLINAGLHWCPGKLLLDSTAIYPNVLVDSTKTLFLIDSLNQIVDSLIIIKTPLKLQGKRTYFSRCGINTQAITRLPAGASIHWMPDSLFVNPNVNPAFFTAWDNVNTIAEISTPHCGLYYDTIEWFIDITPSAYFVMDSASCLGRRFVIYQNCFDSLEWDFGDGSIEKNLSSVFHNFPATGYYYVSLKVWNKGLKTYYNSVYFIDCLGFKNPKNSMTNLKVYPNPAKNKVNIELPFFAGKTTYKILSVTGKLLDEGSFSSIKLELDISHYNQGVYLLKLNNKYFNVTKKIIKH